MSKPIQKIGVIGAGAWGTALAAVARRGGHDVVLHAHESEVADSINQTHVNEAFLPGVELDPGIEATTDLGKACDADAVLLVMPAQFLRAVTSAMAGLWKPGVPAVICCKGIEQQTALLMSEVAAETLDGVPLAVLSGPTFAKEVADGLPTAVTLSCADEALGIRLSDAIGSPRFRAYRSHDLIGAELGGSVKNVLAIACGIVEGRKLGDNARAALITRGLSEITKLAAAKGAEPETLMGLAGLGDLTLTCNAMQSRNFSLGVALGEGRTLAEVMGERMSVAEGVHTASSVTELARRLKVDAPICTAMDGILNHFVDIDAAIEGLLARPVGDEDPFGDGP
ncbi:MAG: NAD(P)H-dependent glycerol-3-phosphate dehydrogenase [Alphaproteobacteria bacterium]